MTLPRPGPAATLGHPGPSEPPDQTDLWTTRRPGTYLLELHLATPAQVVVGHLGQRDLPSGWYVYVGSALGGLGARLRRHARLPKPRHWHIDALREVATLVAVTARLGPERIECQLAAHIGGLPGATIPVRRFGASDCRCGGHLFHFAGPPEPRLSAEWIVMAGDRPAE